MNTIYLFIINNILNLEVNTTIGVRQIATFPLPLIDADAMAIIVMFRVIKRLIPDINVAWSLDVANHTDPLLQKVIDPNYVYPMQEIYA
jgi:hypothetical protein